MPIKIGTFVKVRDCPVKGKVTHIYFEPNSGKAEKYKVQGRYWNRSSVYRVKK